MEIKIYRRWYTDDDVYEGDITYRREEEITHDESWIKETQINLGEWSDDECEKWQEASLAEAVFQLIRDEYVTEYSSYPDWQPHGWYSGRSDMDYHTCEYMEVSVRLDDVPDDVSREVHRMFCEEESNASAVQTGG